MAGLQYYKMKQPSDQKLKRMQAVLLKRLVELFPQLEGHIEEYQTLGPYRQGTVNQSSMHQPIKLPWGQGRRPIRRCHDRFFRSCASLCIR